MINGHLRIRLAPFTREQMDYLPNIDIVGEGHIPHLGMAIAELSPLPGVTGFSLQNVGDESLHLSVSTAFTTDEKVRSIIYHVIGRLQYRTEYSCPDCGTRRWQNPCPRCGRPHKVRT